MQLNSIKSKIKNQENAQSTSKKMSRLSLKINPNNFLHVTKNIHDNLQKLEKSLDYNSNPPIISTLNHIPPLKNSPSKKKNSYCAELYLTYDDIVKQLKKRKRVRHETTIIESPGHSPRKNKLNSARSVNNLSEEKIIFSKSPTIKHFDNELKPINEADENHLSFDKNKISVFTDGHEESDKILQNSLTKTDLLIRPNDKKISFTPIYPKISEKKKAYKSIKSKSNYVHKKKDESFPGLFRKSLSLDGDDFKNLPKKFENFLLDVPEFNEI